MNTQGPDPDAVQVIWATFNQGRYGDAERLLRELTARDPQHEFGWKLLAHVLGLLGRHSEALSTLRQASARARQSDGVRNLFRRVIGGARLVEH